MKFNIWDYFSLLPVFYLALIIVQVYQPFYRYLFLVATLLLALVQAFKYVSTPWLETYPWMKRPEGAKNCNCWNGGGNASGEAGFPSGHVTIISFILVSIFLHVIRSTQHPFLIILWGMYAMVQVYFVGLARLKKKCHSPKQVIAGGALGVSSAVFFTIWSVTYM